MFGRPTIQDTEDDLLRLQQEFLSSQSKPSAQVVRPGDKRKSTDDRPGQQVEPMEDAPSATKVARDVVTLGDLPGDFSHTTASTSVGAPQTKGNEKMATGKPKLHVKFADQHRSSRDDTENPEEELDKHDTHITRVLTDIVEKDLQSLPVYFPSQPVAGGFPKVLHRGSVDQMSPTKPEKTKRKSLFAQQFANRTAEDFGLPANFKNTQRPVKEGPRSKNRSSKLVADTVRERQPIVDPILSQVITGHGLEQKEGPSAIVGQIHEENLARISAMGETEVLKEQKKLLEMLDPSIVSFLKKKKKPSSQPTQMASTAMEVCDEPQKNETTKSAEKPGADVMIDTADLPVAPKREWVHMDKIEAEKLEWLKDLPPPTSGDTKTGRPARFDFEGKLVATDADLPTHMGLHHHGNEPERAGYSLEELFTLARSANMQQRALAINTLTRIIHNAKHGQFHELVSAPLIPALMGGGLLFILRWALDDTTDNTMVAALGCLHALLVTREEEDCLDRVFCWYRGHEVPCMCPALTPESEEEEKESEKLSDAEILKQDIIKGLHAMSLLPRLRYILEVWKPPPIVVVQILDILIRIARHSPEMCYQLTLCPRLLDTIFKDFLPYRLPDDWPDPLTTAYDYPCSWALKLVRVICSAGRHMAANLLSHYPLMDRIVVYITQGKEKFSISHEEFQRVQLEVLRTWKILVSYELALVHFSEYYPLLMKMLQQTSSLGHGCNIYYQQYSCTFLSLLESATHAGASITVRASQQSSAERTLHNLPEGMEHQESTAIPEFNWSHVTGLFPPILLFAQNGLQEFTNYYFEKRYDLTLLSGAVNCVASWLLRADNMPGYDAVESLERTEQLCEMFVLPVLHSRGFKAALEEFRHSSVLLCSNDIKRSESLPNLPELGALVGDHALACPLISEKSTVSFILAIIRLLTAFKTHKGVAEKVYSVLLEEEELLQYLRKVCKMGHSLVAKNYFVQFENYVQELLLTLVKYKPSPTPSAAIYHQVSLILLTHIPEGGEHTIHYLLSGVVFNRDLLSDINADSEPSPVTVDDQLSLHETTGLTSATQQTVSAKSHQLLAETLETMAGVRGTYLKSFGSASKGLEKSRRRSVMSAAPADTFVLGHCGQLLIPIDWMFLPLVEVYNHTEARLGQAVEESVSPAVVTSVTHCLCWVYLLEKFRPKLLNAISCTVKISRILCTFLTGSDLFLDGRVQLYLAALLRIYCKPTHLDKMDFSEDIPGLSSFYDMYMMILDQYAAVSFGDSIFGSYLLFALQQNQKHMLRKALWGERSAVLRALFIPIREVPIPLARFLEPTESDVELVRLYFQALYARSVSPRWCPLFYLIAVHHVNRFCYSQESGHAKLKRAMIMEIQHGKDKTLGHHLLYYKSADPEQELGMTFYDKLPTIRQQLLDSMKPLRS